MGARSCRSRGLRRAAVPNVWRQRRAKRVRCTPGLGAGEDGGVFWALGTKSDGANAVRRKATHD